MVFLPRDSFLPYATTGLVVPTQLVVVLLVKLDETTPHPFFMAEEVACYLGGKGNRHLEMSEGSLAAGENVAASQSR